jgi:hypothetical protein
MTSNLLMNAIFALDSYNEKASRFDTQAVHAAPVPRRSRLACK